MYRKIADMQYLVFHSSTAARPSVNAHQLVKAYMSRVVFFSKEVQISLVPVRMPVEWL